MVINVGRNTNATINPAEGGRAVRSQGNVHGGREREKSVSVAAEVLAEVASMINGGRDGGRGRVCGRQGHRRGRSPRQTRTAAEGASTVTKVVVGSASIEAKAVREAVSVAGEVMTKTRKL